MRPCPQCGCGKVRIHRTFLEKFVYQAVFLCLKCGHRDALWHLFLLGQRSHCPKCWNVRVRKLKGVDQIDWMYKNPTSYIQKWFGANLYWCPFCRLQFYD